MTERLEALGADEAHVAPDWDARRDDLACPLCGYNLRGLNEPRCPECGYRFAWADLTDPVRRVHPYLFEHHPERNWRSFWQTALRGLRPVRFWTSISPTQQGRPFRLVLYWLMGMLLALLCVVGTYGLGYWRLRAWYLTTADLLYVVGPEYLLWWVWGCLWPWLTFLSLMVFRISMRRRRVRSVHVLRCILYSADGLIWGGLSLLLLAAGSILTGAFDNPGPTLITLYVLALCGCAALVVARLCVAYDKYLHFDHPWATVIASQAIVILVGIYLLLEFKIV